MERSNATAFRRTVEPSNTHMRSVMGPGLLTRDEARRIAIDIVKVPDLLRRSPPLYCRSPRVLRGCRRGRYRTQKRTFGCGAICRFWPILLHKSVLQIVRGVLGFLGRAGTMVLRQAAAELRD